MRVAVSNIAWPDGEDEAAAGIIAAQGLRGVELAPTKVFGDPLRASEATLLEHRAFWERRGLEVVALQALLYGRPDLVLFGDADAREAMLAHLVGMMDVARALGARIVVLGAPGSRELRGTSPAAAKGIATELFRRAGAAAAGRGVRLCIEPNPVGYGCEFVTTSGEGRDLVRAVDHPGFGLHLDAAAMALAGESHIDALAPDRLPAHFHAAEPDLAPLGGGAVDHEALGATLRASGYAEWVSVEHRAAPGDPLGDLESSLALARRAYGD